MAEVALTRIQAGGETKWVMTPAGVMQVDEKNSTPPTVFMPGDTVKGLSKEDMDSLRANGSVGDASLLQTVANSTAAILQSAEAEQLAQSDLEAASGYAVNAPPSAPPGEEEIAKAHAIRTDQVARAAGDKPTTEAPSNEEDQPKKAK